MYFHKEQLQPELNKYYFLHSPQTRLLDSS